MAGPLVEGPEASRLQVLQLRKDGEKLQAIVRKSGLRYHIIRRILAESGPLIRPAVRALSGDMSVLSTEIRPNFNGPRPFDRPNIRPGFFPKGIEQLRGDDERWGMLSSGVGRSNRWQIMLKEERARREYEDLASPEYVRNLKERREIEYIQLLKEKIQANRELLRLFAKPQTDNLYRYSPEKAKEYVVEAIKLAIVTGISEDELFKRIEWLLPHIRLWAFTKVG